MVQRPLEERVDMLERRFELPEQLPGRVTALESQIVQLRNEMRAEFSATRAEARLGDERVMQTLRDEIREGDEETRRFMRVLHEDLVRRIELLGERH
jgi:hypothetical protein